MSRQLFEISGVRGRRGTLASGVAFRVYTDEAGAVLAGISATAGATATSTTTVVAGTSTVTTADIAGLGPASLRFYGPDDVDTLYLAVPSDASLGVQKIGAATDPRLDALEAGGGGGTHPNLAVHDALGLATDAELTTHAADTTAVHGITDTSVLATATSVASSIITHAAAIDPHADRAYARSYADSVAQGLDVKLSVRVASTANLTLSGEQTIDGVLTSADRVLVKNQTAGAGNGIYVSAAGAWTRAVDADISAEVSPGSFTFVEEGTVNGGTGWVQTAPDPITLGTTALVFTQFSGGGTIIGGAGLLKTGNTMDVGAGTGITVGGDTVGIASGGVTNTQVSAAAGIAESKLALNFPTHAVDHASRHAAAGADPLTGYVVTGDHTLAAHDTLGLVTDAILATHAVASDPHTGYVLESAHTHLIDPEDPAYGADGTGVANSQAALAAACAAALTLDLPVVARPGRTFRINTPLIITQDGITLDFQGSTIRVPNSAAVTPVQVQGDDVVLRNLVVDGNRSNGGAGGGIFWTGARGKAYDCEASHCTAAGWTVQNSGASLEAWRCKGNDNVSAGNSDGFLVVDGALIRLFQCEADDNDRSGFRGGQSSGAGSAPADGCHLDGFARRNGNTGVTFQLADYGTVGDLTIIDCNGFGFVLGGAAIGWQCDTIRVRNAGAALAGLGLASNGAGTSVELYGVTDCHFGLIDSLNSQGYGLALANEGATYPSGNKFGTVLCQVGGDPAVLFSTGAHHNHVGVAIIRQHTLGINFGEGSVTPHHNSVGLAILDECSYGGVKFDDGAANRIDRIVARNVTNIDPSDVSKAVVQFGGIAGGVAGGPATDNVIGWLDYEHDAALATAEPIHLAWANSVSTGNRINGRYNHANVQTSCALDDNGANRLSFTADVRWKTVRRSAGDYTLNSTSWTNVDTGLDLALDAVRGDVIEVNVSGLYNVQSVSALLDCATLVGGSPVTYFSSGTTTQDDGGIQSWRGISGAVCAIGGPAQLKLTAADIAAGQVTLRLRYKTSAAVAKTLFGTTNTLFQFSAKNLGCIAT